MKKILVTGASGFVGGFLIEECLKRNLEVYAGIRKTSKRTYLQDSRIKFFEVDFPDVEGMSKRLAKAQFDYIIHNAGVVAAPKKETYFQVNTEYTKRFVEAIEASKIPEKFTYISSIAASGPASAVDKSDFLKVEQAPAPITTYGRSKLQSELFLKEESNLPWLIFRPTVVYGPREQDLFTFFKLLNRHFEPGIGFQKQDLTFVFIKDLARLLVNATLSTESQKTYFVSDGDYYGTKDLGRLAKQFLNKKTFKLTVPTPLAKIVAAVSEIVAKTGGRYPTFNLEKVAELTAQNWKCDIEPLKRDFNFRAEYNLEQGLKETIGWYKENGWL